MYRVLLLDDEPWALLGAKRIYPWERHGFEICASFSNPLLALEYIKGNPVDFVLSDVRMPDMTGIEFMKQALSHNNHLVFAFVSGYADFSYVQQALRRGAYDYLLKPVSPEDANSFVVRLADYMNSLRLAHDASLYRDLQNGVFSIPQVFPEHSGQSAYHLQGILVQCSGSSLPALPFPDDVRSLVLNLGLGKHFILASSPCDLLPFATENWSAQNDILSIALSGFNADDDTRRVISQAEQADITLRFAGEGRIAAYRPFPKASIRKIMDQLSASISGGSFDVCAAVLNDAVAQGIQPEDAVLIWNHALLWADTQSIEYTEFTYLTISSLLQNFRDYRELWASLIDILKDRESTSSTVEHSELYTQMLAYIDAHFTEELYLKDIANNLYINFSYACELFKKHSGTTFSKHLTNLRMKKSAELLLSTDLTIEEICYRVGYNNYSYFNKIFRKTFAITPYQYRVNHKALS